MNINGETNNQLIINKIIATSHRLYEAIDMSTVLKKTLKWSENAGRDLKLSEKFWTACGWVQDLPVMANAQLHK